MAGLDHDEVKDAVRSHYAQAAQGSSCGCAPSTSCCGGASTTDVDEISRQLGYAVDELAAVPEGANLGLGCGNPQAIAALQPGEVVLDLGSGAGFDCFLAARSVGEAGSVIGVDMTPDMVSKARANASASEYTNVEFRLGEIEHLPVADDSVDVLISNCVINLSPDKPAVFREAWRVLRPGGRLAISDVVATAPLPESVLDDLRLLSACLSGAAEIKVLESMMAEAGFARIDIQPLEGSSEFIRDWVPGSRLEEYVRSASIQAVKP